jgi:hypothetical protein
MKNKIDKPLSEMQKNFARLHVENSFGKGMLSNTECAIKAGYAPESAYQRAHELLNPRICPHVVKYIGEMKEDFRKKNNIDPDKHLGRLHHLALKAEEEKMYGVALRAEELRGKVAGYYIDKKLNINKNLEDKTEEELEEDLLKILNDHKQLIGLKKELKKGDIDYGKISKK